MTNGSALGVSSTGARARIFAFLIDASLLRRALRVAHAFRFAIRWNS